MMMRSDDLIPLARSLRSGFCALAAALCLHLLGSSPLVLTLVAPRWAAATDWMWPWASCLAAVLAGFGAFRVETALSGRGYRGWRWIGLAGILALLMLMWKPLASLGPPGNDWLPGVLTAVQWLSTAVSIVALVWLTDLLRRLTRALNRPWHEATLLHAAVALVVISVIVKVAILTLGSILVCIALRDGVKAPALQWVRLHSESLGILQVSADVLWAVVVLAVLLDGIRRLRRIDRGCCLRCGYDLRGDFDHNCPECGWRRDATSGAAQP